ncbi:lactoylglutathione lyase family protein [Silvanigrella sp.]|jgi:lactoylglutathione lyase family protein|uniref:lactoylglutathione lyase family protein n=1 Tax=Silvanigrella sp. TaxID=2024976 RepID=UPI0037C51DFE
MNKPYPRAFSHIGITVPDLEKAIQFYEEVLGFYMIMRPTEIREDPKSIIGMMCKDVFGPGYGSFRIAHLSTSDKIGVELFEFPQTNSLPMPEFFPFKTGLFHFCVQDPNVEELAEKIVEAGGKQRMPVRYFNPGVKPFSMVYCEDPFGNIIEIYSHSYEMIYADGAY